MNQFQRVITVVSGLAFLGLMLSPLSGLINQSPDSQSNSGNPNSRPPEEQLQNIAKGYEQVLKREPNNPVALQGLAEAKLQMRDLKGAINPLEKLSNLYPEQKELKALLEKIKKQVIAEEKSQKPQPSATPSPKSDNKNPSPTPSFVPTPFETPTFFPTPSSSPTPTRRGF